MPPSPPGALFPAFREIPLRALLFIPPATPARLTASGAQLTLLQVMSISERPRAIPLERPPAIAPSILPRQPPEARPWVSLRPAAIRSAFRITHWELSTP